MTDTQRFQQIAELFESARTRSGQDREWFLREACANDPDLLARVRGLLTHHETDDAPLATPVVPEGITIDMFPPPTAPPIPEAIGRYRVQRQLGIGGMGVVYLAEQDRPQRRVAVKVIRPGVLSRNLLKRFEFEAQALARLQHPGIAQIYEVGAFHDGAGQRPFFVMELIKGEPLLAYADQQQLETRHRLELFLRVCDAVHHAHQRGVVHRDIKPANILIDATGQPKVLDFGVARATDADLQVTTLQTSTGQLVGTLPYMSPEQLAGHETEVDVCSDVYALGVTLYELLCGRLPYDLADTNLLSAARKIVDADPVALSAVRSVYRGDLNTIVLKALEKDPDRRYQAASELAADIRRFLTSEPIVARPATTLYVARKFAARHRGLVAGIAVAAVVLVAGSAVSTILALGQAAARRDASERADQLESVVSFQAAQISAIDPAAMGEQLRRGILTHLAEHDPTDASPAPSERAAGDLERELAGIDFTELAKRTLETNLFDPTIEAVEAQFADQPLVRADLYQSLASTLRYLGLYDSAVVPQERALALREELLDEDDPKILDSVDTLGLLLKQSGKLAEAAPYYSRSLAGRRRVLGDSHPDTLVSMINSGLLFKGEGKLDEAEQLLQEAYQKSLAALGKDHWITLQALTNVGIIAENRGRFDDALRCYEEALGGRRDTLGPEHPDTLTALNNVGATLVRLGRLGEATPYFEEALATRRRVLGGAHPSTIASISNMGVLLRRQNKLEAAEPFYREALELRRATLGDLHPSTLGSMNNMASLLVAGRRFNDAMMLYDEAIRGYRQVLGPSHSDTLRCTRSKIRLLIRQHRFAEAEQMGSDAYALVRGVHGESGPETVEICRTMVELFDAWKEAEPDAGHEQSAIWWRDRLALSRDSRDGR